MRTDTFRHQLSLPGFELVKTGEVFENNGKKNKLKPKDRKFHDWYRFVLSFPPHLVRRYLKEFELDGGHMVLDPFCGTGTTLVESKLNGIRSVGLEANPFAHFASSIKPDWNVDPNIMLDAARKIADSASKLLRGQGIDDRIPFYGSSDAVPMKTLPPEKMRLLLKNSVSPLPLHKTLVLMDCLNEYCGERFFRHLQLALANALVFTIGDLHFGPEVGVGENQNRCSGHIILAGSSEENRGRFETCSWTAFSSRPCPFGGCAENWPHCRTGFH